ncbi:MAG TPA: peptidoglycan editing factor PgeF [Candidatus Acidoferrum sp.]|nr:peptidoglycan editing factor PgeF [Candidatus Acidoferrum sp.]
MKYERILTEGAGVPYLTTPDFAARPELVAGFATRRGGVSRPPYDTFNFGFNRGDDPEAVRQNYRIFASAIGADPERFAAVKQVHSSVVLRAPQETLANPFTKEKIKDADGVITNTPGVFPVCYFADCIPTLLYEPDARCWAAVHSGWRGAAEGIVGIAISRMKEELGADPAKMLMAIGPSICPECFEVGPEVAGKFDADLVLTGYEKPHVDLWRAVERSAVSAGVLADHITCMGECTMEFIDCYFSHRAHGERRGVLMAAIGLPAQS